jgi:hypothetical protein
MDKQGYKRNGYDLIWSNIKVSVINSFELIREDGASQIGSMFDRDIGSW